MSFALLLMFFAGIIVGALLQRTHNIARFVDAVIEKITRLFNSNKPNV